MNKNTRRIKKQVAQALKQNETEIVVQAPAFDYHNYTKDDVRSGKGFVNKTIPVPVMGKDGVVSCSRHRNMQMRILHNKGQGGTHSLTSHEPIDSRAPIIFKNHNYMEYKQSISLRA